MPGGSLQQAETRRADRVIDRGQLSDELGEMAGEDVLRHEHGVPTPIVRRPFHDEHSRVHRNIKEFGVDGVNERGANCLGSPANIDRQELVETGSLNVSQRQQRTEMVGAPDGDPSEWCTISQIEAPCFQHSLPQQRRHVSRSVDELEVEHLPFRGAARRRQLPFDRGQHGEALRQPIRGCEPSNPLPRLDHTLLAQHLERFANGHTTGLIRRAEIGLARQQAASGKLAAEDAIAQIICDLGIAK